MRIGLAHIHRQPSPAMVAMVRQRGMNGLGDVNAKLQDWLSSLSAEPATDAAVGCGPGGGQPCASPQDAANAVYGVASGFCQLEADQSTFAGYVPDPGCSDGGQAAAAAVYPAVLALFNSFPASVWTTEAANAASGMYYGQIPAGPCPPGQFVQVGPNGTTCYGSTANQDITNTPINITTGQPLPSPAPVTSPVITAAAPVIVSAPVPITSSSVAPSGSGSSTTISAVAPDPFAFLTQSLFDGIPNWALLAGGLAVVMLLPSLIGGRR